MKLFIFIIILIVLICIIYLGPEGVEAICYIGYLIWKGDCKVSLVRDSEGMPCVKVTLDYGNLLKQMR